MAKVASSTATKRASTTRSATAALKPRSRTTKEAAELPLVSTPSAEPSVDGLQLLAERLTHLEEKLTTSLSSFIAEIHDLKSTSPAVTADGNLESETALPIISDLVRRHLMEHLNPLIASLKRIEERVGFIGNRLRQPVPSQDQRQKPSWRHDQQQRHNRPRGHNGAPRPGPGQGQQWTPPSAASVQGHFAPRPLRGGEKDHVTEDDE